MEKEKLINSLKARGFSKKVVNAFEKVQREDFVPENLKDIAYLDTALPIGKDATISQPYTIAFMLDLFELKDNLKILEIGSGSGYVLALIKKISKNSEIYGIELNKELAENSKNKLKDVEILNKNGFYGYKENSPYDRILASASFQEIPKHLFEQLKEKGILVCPVKDSIYQFKKINNKINKKKFEGFVFVPMLK